MTEPGRRWSELDRSYVTWNFSDWKKNKLSRSIVSAGLVAPASASFARATSASSPGHPASESSTGERVSTREQACRASHESRCGAEVALSSAARPGDRNERKVTITIQPE